ncbi:MAG: hypothetical protein AAFV53_02635 [Myxococcota bacterium]
MLIGLIHSHSTLAYLIFVIALVNLVAVLAKARTDANIARFVRYSHEFGILWAGRVNLLLGFALWYLVGYPATTWWIWVTILLWGPIEAMGRRFVKAELQMVQDGGQASTRLVTGTAVQLVCIVVIFGLMSVRPG